MRIALCALLLLSCTKTLDIALEVVPACDQGDVFDGIQTISLIAEGDALDVPRERTFQFNSGSGKLAAVPPTTGAQVTVLARRGTEDSPVDVAGSAGPYDFSGQDERVGTNVRVVVGRTATFAGTSAGPKPTMCTFMQRARQAHTATLLQDGRVFIAGGEEISAGETLILRNTEIYQPSTGTFEAGPDLPEGRSHHSASLLPNGRVLVCGGRGAIDGRQVSLGTCLIYDPSDGTFVGDAVLLNNGRMRHRAVTLPDQRVVLFGGIATGNDYLPTTEIYDPAQESVQRLNPGPNMGLARADHTATVLNDGSVLLVGGRDEDDVQTEAEIWNGEGSRGVGATLPRYGHAAAKVDDGRVVIAGGFTTLTDVTIPPATATVEIFDSASGGSISCGNELSLLSPRGELFASPLGRASDGKQRVLFGGGLTPDGAVINIAEMVTLGRGKSCADATVEATRGQMRIGRMNAVPVTLFGGDVLLTGGATALSPDSEPASAGEIFIVPR